MELTGGSDGETQRLGYAYGRAGDVVQARELLDELLRRSSERYVDPTFIAVVYAGLGDREKTFEWLEKAYEARSFELSWTRVLAVYDDLRDDPRFQDLTRRIGRPTG